MPVIAVDGPAASGKGTIARALAAHFHLPHLDTGLLYRGVALSARQHGTGAGDAAALAALAAALDPLALSDPELRSDEVGAFASRIAATPAVRAALLSFQQQFAARPGGAVLDGRDIGTVIAPAADAKLFVTAAPAIRARRRYLELQQRGGGESEEAVRKDLVARDERDRERANAPLLQAADAYLLDTSNLDIGAAVRQAVSFVSSRLVRTS